MHRNYPRKGLKSPFQASSYRRYRNTIMKLSVVEQPEKSGQREREEGWLAPVLTDLIGHSQESGLCKGNEDPMSTFEKVNIMFVTASDLSNSRATENVLEEVKSTKKANSTPNKTMN